MKEHNHTKGNVKARQTQKQPREIINRRPVKAVCGLKFAAGVKNPFAK